MRYLGLDLGTKTLGVSVSDETRTIATPVGTIHFEEKDYLSFFEELGRMIEEYHIGKIVLGLPKNMNNTIGDRADETLRVRDMIRDKFQIEVDLQDERLSTVSAHHYLLEANVSRKKRKKVVDKMAANIILQTYLDKEKGR